MLNISLSNLYEGVDMDMLISLNNTDMKDCMRDVGIKRFRDRHKIVESISIEERKVNSNIFSNLSNSGNHKHKQKEVTVNEEEDILNEVDERFYIQEVNSNTLDVDAGVWDRLEERAEDSIEERDNIQEINEDSEVQDKVDDKDRDEEVSLEESVTDPQNDCILCMHANQHFCRKCLKPVCNVFCSEQDSSSTNEMHRKHRVGDVRYISSGFECPMCSKKFMTQLELQSHIEIEHEQEKSLSLLSEASSGWINEGSTVQEKDDFISEVSME